MTTAHQTPAYDLIREIRAAFNELKSLSDSMNADLGITAAMRAILEFSCTHPPHTVPQIAQAKSVSRQHVQLLADALNERGLVAYAPNPKHKTSRLVEITPRGRALFDTIAERETRALARLDKRLRDTDLAAAAHAVARLRAEIASLSTD